MTKKMILIVISLVLIIIMISTSIYVIFIKLHREKTEKSTLSLWATYWSKDDLFIQLKEKKEEIRNLSFFAAYFDNDNKVFIPEVTARANEDVNRIYNDRTWKHYLTIVNDKVKEDGSSSLKDDDLLRSIFKNEESMYRHITEIITLALQGNYDGIEIDYESIRKDMELWEKFIIFCEEIYKKASQNDLELRIILEPGAPMDTIQFPTGPQYAVMCYNLYGYGTEPGPKSNPDFIEKLVDKAKSLPDEVEFVLATGGFSWEESGQAKAITSETAKQILETSKAILKRDEESQCLYYEYQDENGHNHTIWYADQETITYLINTLNNLEVTKYGIW